MTQLTRHDIRIKPVTRKTVSINDSDAITEPMVALDIRIRLMTRSGVFFGGARGVTPGIARSNRTATRAGWSP
jgi:hypothetical protein